MSARQPIIGHHLIWSLYGHWLPNDPRGSGSSDLYQEKLAPLGAIHQGRKPEHLQPSRGELREFHRRAEPLLEHCRFWLDAAKRQALGDTFSEVIQKRNYTVWALAVLRNHAHLVIRKHRDDALTMWHQFADESRLRLREFDDIAMDHPVWSDRPHKVFLCTPQEVRGRTAYVERNPAKEGLPPQPYDFVTLYNNWPFDKKAR